MEEDTDDLQVHPTDNWFQKLSKKTKNVIKNITVEPALFVMFLGIGLDGSTLDQMQIDKCCRDDFDFNETVCQNLTDDQYKNQSSMVSDEVGLKEPYSVCNWKILVCWFHFCNSHLFYGNSL